MTGRFVVDSSVLVAAFRTGEAHSDEGFRLLTHLLDAPPKVLVPETAFVEVVAALRRRTQDGPLVDRVVQILQALPGLSIVPLPPRRTLIEVARRSSLRGMDAIVVATAVVHRVPLITFDREMHRLAVPLVRVTTITEALS